MNMRLILGAELSRIIETKEFYVERGRNVPTSVFDKAGARFPGASRLTEKKDFFYTAGKMSKYSIGTN